MFTAAAVSPGFVSATATAGAGVAAAASFPLLLLLLSLDRDRVRDLERRVRFDLRCFSLLRERLCLLLPRFVLVPLLGLASVAPFCPSFVVTDTDGTVFRSSAILKNSAVSRL